MRSSRLGIGALATLGLLLAPLGARAEDEAKPPYRLRVLASRLAGATFVTAAPGDRAHVYVVQRHGLVRVVGRDGAVARTPFLDIRSETTSERERGLLSIAFDPRYAQNHKFYAFYTGRDGEVKIVEYSGSAARADPTTARVLVQVAHPDSGYHNGGQLSFGPDGRLYAGIGDGGYTGIAGPTRPEPDPHGNSQNLETLLAKIFSLDVDEPSPSPRIAAYGLRNPWRFSFTNIGDLVIGDVGYNAIEEIDVLPRSAAHPVNFGWSVYEGRQKRPGAQVTLNSSGTLLFPVLTYATGKAGNCAITGGYVYRGAVRRLRGRYVFGDYCSGRIWSVVLRNGEAQGRRLEPVRAPGLTSFGEGPTGELFAVTLGGKLYQFMRA